MSEVVALKAVEPTVCWPWHLHRLVDGAHPKGGACRYCGREIAVPVTAGALVCCLYCAMDRGIVEAIEVPFP